MLYSAEIFGTPTKRIMDPVHGSIPIFSHEQRIIDDPLFQRLRHIFQNDVVFLVFPGAKHDRFLHSVGTMHMISQLFSTIIASYFSGKDSLINADQKESIQYLHSCLRLAALLHDTGHCPFSHQFEHADAIKQVFNPELFTKLWEGHDYSTFYKEKINHISHEHFSVRISYELLSKQDIPNLTKCNIEDILFFLETTECKPSDRLIHHSKNLINFFVPAFESLVALESLDSIMNSFLKFLKSFISGEFDADKMDYILRDSYFSGCPYGKYNKDHLTNSLRVGYELYFSNPDSLPTKSISNSSIFDIEFSLAIYEKGVGALEDFIYARYQLYLELYNHKTVSGFRKLLSVALDEVLSEADIKMEISEKLSNLNKFINFTDTFFWEKFRFYSEQNPNSACRMLVNRNKLKYVGRRVNEESSEIEKLCRRLSNSRSKKVDFWKSNIKFSKINEYYNTIKVLIKQDDNSLGLKKLSKVTDFFEKFQRKEVFHLFEIPSFSKMN